MRRLNSLFFNAINSSNTLNHTNHNKTMNQKTLILFGTRKGTTTKTCEVIAEVLTDHCDHEVEMINVKDFKKVKKRLNEFNTIILGSSIVSGRWVSKCLRILKSLDTNSQKLAVFVTAGGTMHKVEKYGITKAEAIREGIEKYIDTYLIKYKKEVIAKMVFGGRVVRKEKVRYDNWNGR